MSNQVAASAPASGAQSSSAAIGANNAAGSNQVLTFTLGDETYGVDILPVWLGNTFDDIRENASLRWREHRARRDQPVEPIERTDEALRRMEGNGEA